MAARMAASNANGPIGRTSTRIGWYVNHDDVLVRFVSLWVVVASVFAAVWILSYLSLPQELLPPAEKVTLASMVTTRRSGSP